MTTTPGYGTAELHLGQASPELQKQIGQPHHRRKSGAFREYWVYPDQRFEAIVSRRSNRLLSLFFHRGSTLAAVEFFGKTEKQILNIFGEPWKVGGDMEFADGDHIRRWLAYRSGIGFFFDKEGIVETVSISARSRQPDTKPVSRVTMQHTRRIAALVRT
jgi:hypothetical protein